MSDEEKKGKCCKFKVDRRLETILINPRLLGLPKARVLSATIFFLIIAANIGLSIVLARVNLEEVCTAESSVYGTGENCEEIVYTEQVGYRFSNDFLFVGTKAYLAVEISDNEKFSISNALLTPTQADELQICDNPFDTVFCLHNVSYATLLPDTEEVDADIVLPRLPGDQLWNIQIDPQNAVKLYFSDPSDISENFIVNAVLDMVDGESEVATLDVTCLPNIVSGEPPLDTTQSIVTSVLRTVVVGAGRNDLFGISLSTRFARCCRKRGLSAFEYFGLLFDYTFILEGFLTVTLALGILKCLGYKTVADDEIEAKSLDDDEIEVKKVSPENDI
mmetsp:Transcript_19929/g.25862  ORF Transcript_19929/g.25862 Transcript_19929/m.25862 type:complete len:334 (+) Transcript_19929:256-1257(+)